MKLLTQKISNIFDRTINFLALMAAILLIFLMLSISVNVATRALIEWSIVWMFEIDVYALLYITFLGAAWLLKSEGHVKMDLVFNQFKPRAQATINIITSVISAIVFLVVAWQSARVTWITFQTDYFFVTVLEPPAWPIILIIPIGSFLLFIQLLRRTYSYVEVWRAGPDTEQSLP